MDEKEKKKEKINQKVGIIYINKFKNRLLSLSPTVKAGIERECTKG